MNGLKLQHPPSSPHQAISDPGGDCQRRAWEAVTPLVVKPVSYTHLRAHETLRYLVCRLLLEKKI